ncbi:MAG: ClbS/DfsB family four-helix bundle protein [Alphaproteobacteria bacterium]|nr:ClbS/DfsB family four-helix bundle protein [Alphaproteobacteria bacterium]
MAASNKSELMEITQKEFEKLTLILDKVDEKWSLIGDEDDTSIRDIVIHRAHWIDLFLGWYEDGQAGKEVFFPAKGYKWNDLKRYNADLRSRCADVTWTDARNRLNAAHRKLVGFVQDRSERELYGGPMKGANNNWTPGRWAEAAGPSHFRSAAKYVRSRVKDFSS